MPTACDRAPLPRRRLLPLTVLIAAAVALLAFAGTAAAETKVGEGTSPEQPTLAGEADLLKATASFDVAAGTASFEITTRAAQESTPEAERPEIQYVGTLITAHNACTREALEAEEEKAFKEGKEAPFFPAAEVFSFNRQLTAEETPPGVPLAQAYGIFATSNESIAAPTTFIPGTKSLSGNTATVSVTIPAVAGSGTFNCAEVASENFEEAGEPDLILFPLTTKPEPPPAVTPAPAPRAQAQPAPPVAALSIAKAKKALKLKVGRWATVKVKVTNTGGAASSPGSLQLKATKGVIVKRGKQKLPILAPGGSWTVSYKVKLTTKAKKTSTLSLVGAAGTLAAKGSLVLKLLGG
jgi:hypothetical protein